MEFNDIITFEGGINTDDAAQAVPKGDYRDFKYCRLGYNSGNAFAVETSDGTLVIPNPAIEVADQIIGATAWQKQNAIVYFVFKANSAHEIWVYYIDTQTHTLAVQSSDLNFSRDWPVYHANIVDDILKWTDGRWDDQMYDADANRLFNPPYQINLAKALESPSPNGYYGVIDLQTIDAIKWPMDPPRVSYFTDSNRQDNKLRNKLFKFIIQPIYENGEVGVWSMYSNLDLPEQSELVSGTNWVYPNNSNGINIQFYTGPKIIRKFNIAVQQFDKDSMGVEPPFGVFLQLDKEQDSITDNVYHVVSFYGGVATSPAIDVFKNYDRLPLESYCQEYLPTNQIVYTNFREGYNKPSELYELLNVYVGFEFNEITWNPWGSVSFLQYENYFNGYWISNYIVDNADISYDPNTLFPFSNGMVFSYTDQNNQLIYYSLSQEDINSALSQPSIFNSNEYIFQIIGDSFASQMGFSPGSVVTGPFPNQIKYDGISGDIDLFDANISTSNITNAQPSLKAGATHEFGIVYGDRAYRDSTVYTVDSMNLFVPWFYDINRSGFSNPENPFTINPRFTINHIPPIWATKYWIVAKPATEIQSFGQYTTNSIAPNAPGGTPYLSSIKLDAVTNNRYIISLDKYYVNQNIGASIEHEIKIGDKVRFIRTRPGGLTASAIPYLPYLELDVIGYNPTGGEAGRPAVYVNIFNTALVDPYTSLVDDQLFGALLEIYTPRPSTDDTGNIFVSTWKDISEAIEIRNPHTVNRAHGAPPKYYLNVGVPPGGIINCIYISGDYTFLDGQNLDITIHNVDGTTQIPIGVTVTFVRYDSDLNVTVLTIPGVPPSPTIAYITVDNTYQAVNNLISITAAQFALNYGDIYVRQRNYQTGLIGAGAVLYYYIEDPNYSDYWLSDVHNTGRTRIEDQNAKMVHRQATAIHSDSFIFNTQINGLSSFALDNQNIEDMNPTFGEVVRTYLSGREGKTLKCLQPKKENSIYIQYYPNEVGSDSTVRVSNRTFASWFDYRSLMGCTDAGATAILPDGSTMYFDNNTGVFVYSTSNGQSVVSEIDPDTGKDYKFRTKTKQLAKLYNANPDSVVRTYVNPKFGEVGFAFRFGTQYKGDITSTFNPPFINDEAFLILGGDFTYLYGYNIVIYFPESGNTYSGVISNVDYPGGFNSLIYIDGVIPDIADYAKPAYYYTTSGFTYDHVVFDYVNMRWRSTYDYNFQQYCNLGQTLVGWGIDNELYVHNQQGNWNFHGEPFIQEVSFVSNETPLALKRYQDISLISNEIFSVEAESDPNKNYPLGMKTTMPFDILKPYEGYAKTYYRKNLYDPRFLSDAVQFQTLSNYDPPIYGVNGWTVGGDQTILLGQNLTIIQSDGSIFTGQVASAVYDIPTDLTWITLSTGGPGTFGVSGYWYNSDRAMLNGEDIRANALTHTLYYDPVPTNEASLLYSVAIKGVLS